MVNAVGVVDQVIQALLYILGISVLCLGVFAVWLMTQFKHKVRVRDVVRGRTIIQDVKAREYTDNNSITWWKLNKKINGKKVKIPEPPSECVDIDRKGKKILEVYKTEDSGYIPITDVFAQDFSAETKIEAFKPFTTEQRALLIDELEKSEALKKKKTLNEIIAQAVPYVALIIILSVTFLMWGEAVTPIIEVGQNYDNLLTKTTNILGRADSIVNDRQLIIGGETSQPLQNVTAPN